MDWSPFDRLALSLGLGLLVGFQREWAAKRLAGIRTFPLVTLFGTLAAQLAEAFGGWVLAGALLALATTIWRSEHHSEHAASHPGITTEVALLAMFAVGAVVARGSVAVAVAAGGTVAVLLHWKHPLHRFVGRVAEADARSVMQLVLMGLVILPALPRQGFGPYQVLNPFEIWSMVVLIVGISLAAYLAQRVLGPRTGTVLAGVLGGLISSTATAVSYARRSRADADQVPAAALVIAISSTVVVPRLLLVSAIVSPGAFPYLAPPLLAMGVVLAAISLLTYGRSRDRLTEATDDHPPSDLRAAVAFGLLYAAVLFATAAATSRLGERGLFLVAGLSGLTDVDAITLSTLKLAGVGAVELSTGWRLILIGLLANITFKGGVGLLWGHARLRGWIVTFLGAALASGAVVLRFGPWQA